jgi:hypothetical protein
VCTGNLKVSMTCIQQPGMKVSFTFYIKQTLATHAQVPAVLTKHLGVIEFADPPSPDS